MSDHDLWDLFEQFGAKVKMVSVQLRRWVISTAQARITDCQVRIALNAMCFCRDKSEKSAHAIFHSSEDANMIRNECNNRELEGHTIRVEIFRKMRH